MKNKVTGRVNVYVCHSPNFFGKIRPAHDSSADAVGELTDGEVSTLRSMIARYIEQCHARHGKENLDKAFQGGSYS